MKKNSTKKRIVIITVLSLLTAGSLFVYKIYDDKYKLRNEQDGPFNYVATKTYKMGHLDTPTPWEFRHSNKKIYKGIDLSHHNHVLDFDALKKVDFIYHKATEGSTFRDLKFKTRMEQFVQRGIYCGAYHFFTTTISAEKQFENFASVVPKDLPLIPVLDIERNKGKWSKRKLNIELDKWIKLCEKHYGVKPIIYSSSDFYIKYNLKQHNCKFWSGDVNFPPRVDYIMHQKKIIPVEGMAGKVDYDEASQIPLNPKAKYK